MRADLLQLEQSQARRVWSGLPVEFRATSDGATLTFDGYASTTETAYEVFGGAPYGWNETMARGAFKKTIAERADVSFLVNHEGISLARTKSGTLKLSEDDTGLRAVASLDPKSNAVNDLRSAVSRGDVDEMSFGFRVVQDEWTDEEGRASDRNVGVNRRILEVNMNKGDVSAVNYGANPTTSGGFRSVDLALSELRAGRTLEPEQRELVLALVRTMDGATRTPGNVTPSSSPLTTDIVNTNSPYGPSDVNQCLADMQDCLNVIRDYLGGVVDSVDVGVEGKDITQVNARMDALLRRAEPDPVVARLFEMHLQRTAQT